MKQSFNLHFGLGILFIIHFAITGQLMKSNYFEVKDSDTLVRMMLRANHIYILFAGLINLVLSFTFDNKKPNFLYLLASIILIFATISLNISFYFDPKENIGNVGSDMGRIFTNYSVKGVLAGTALYLVILLWQKIKK